jgi:hypothetical protein
MPRPGLNLEMVVERCSRGNGSYYPTLHIITMFGKLSVVTYLHEFGHARGYGERKACRFSINIFRRVWPRLFARCRHERHMLVVSPRKT